MYNLKFVLKSTNYFLFFLQVNYEIINLRIKCSPIRNVMGTFARLHEVLI